MDLRTAAVVLVFLLSYALITARRLRWLPIGRPAGALLGAVLMVAVGGLTPRQSYERIDHDTIALLFGMMLITAHLERAGFFAWSGERLLVACHGSPRRLLGGLSLLAAVLSALLVNDTVCLFLTPIVVAACRRGGLPLGPYLLTLATSANIGSVATPVGNPQNMIIGNHSVLAGPVTLLCLGLNLLLLWAFYGRRLPARVEHLEGAPEVDPRRLRWVALVSAVAVAGMFLGWDEGWTAIGGGVALLVLLRDEPQEIFARVDWALLVFFSALFIVVGALDATGLVARAFQALTPHMHLDTAAGTATWTAGMLVGSNLVSNVPLVTLASPYMHQFGDPTLAWILLAFVTTVAGNLTLIGSVANIIVAERAQPEYTLGFVEYLLFGVPSTLLVLAAGVPFLVWWVGLVG
jgi:Na+/H+ antiporter NhaD/arsenite permease-like protein